jgi:LysM repeat protein
MLMSCSVLADPQFTFRKTVATFVGDEILTYAATGDRPKSVALADTIIVAAEKSGFKVPSTLGGGIDKFRYLKTFFMASAVDSEGYPVSRDTFPSKVIVYKREPVEILDNLIFEEYYAETRLRDSPVKGKYPYSGDFIVAVKTKLGQAAVANNIQQINDVLNSGKPISENTAIKLDDSGIIKLVNEKVITTGDLQRAISDTIAEAKMVTPVASEITTKPNPAESGVEPSKLKVVGATEPTPSTDTALATEPPTSATDASGSTPSQSLVNTSVPGEYNRYYRVDIKELDALTAFINSTKSGLSILGVDRVNGEIIFGVNSTDSAVINSLSKMGAKEYVPESVFKTLTKYELNGLNEQKLLLPKNPTAADAKDYSTGATGASDELTAKPTAPRAPSSPAPETTTPPVQPKPTGPAPAPKTSPSPAPKTIAPPIQPKPAAPEPIAARKPTATPKVAQGKSVFDIKAPIEGNLINSTGSGDVTANYKCTTINQFGATESCTFSQSSSGTTFVAEPPVAAPPTAVTPIAPVANTPVGTVPPTTAPPTTTAPPSVTPPADVAPPGSVPPVLDNTLPVGTNPTATSPVATTPAQIRPWTIGTPGFSKFIKTGGLYLLLFQVGLEAANVAKVSALFSSRAQSISAPYAAVPASFKGTNGEVWGRKLSEEVKPDTIFIKMVGNEDGSIIQKDAWPSYFTFQPLSANNILYEKDLLTAVDSQKGWTGFSSSLLSSVTITGGYENSIVSLDPPIIIYVDYFVYDIKDKDKKAVYQQYCWPEGAVPNENIDAKEIISNIAWNPSKGDSGKKVYNCNLSGLKDVLVNDKDYAIVVLIRLNPGIATIAHKEINLNLDSAKCTFVKQPIGFEKYNYCDEVFYPLFTNSGKELKPEVVSVLNDFKKSVLENSSIWDAITGTITSYIKGIFDSLKNVVVGDAGAATALKSAGLNSTLSNGLSRVSALGKVAFGIMTAPIPGNPIGIAFTGASMAVNGYSAYKTRDRTIGEYDAFVQDKLAVGVAAEGYPIIQMFTYHASSVKETSGVTSVSPALINSGTVSGKALSAPNGKSILDYLRLISIRLVDPMSTVGFVETTAVKTQTAQAPVAPASSTTSTATIAPAASTTPVPDNSTTYTISGGETLERISEVNSVELSDLLRANPKIRSNADLKPGVVLIIPRKAATNSANSTAPVPVASTAAPATSVPVQKKDFKMDYFNFSLPFGFEGATFCIYFDSASVLTPENYITLDNMPDDVPFDEFYKLNDNGLYGMLKDGAVDCEEYSDIDGVGAITSQSSNIFGVSYLDDLMGFVMKNSIIDISSSAWFVRNDEGVFEKGTFSPLNVLVKGGDITVRYPYGVISYELENSVADNKNYLWVNKVTGGYDVATSPGEYVEPTDLEHILLEGETLESIAEIYKVKVEDLLKANPKIKNNGDLKEMNILIIPVGKPANNDTSIVKTSTTTWETATNYPNSLTTAELHKIVVDNKLTGLYSHIISEGDTLTTLEDLYGTPKNIILQANPAVKSDSDLKPDYLLVIPVGQLTPEKIQQAMGLPGITQATTNTEYVPRWTSEQLAQLEQLLGVITLKHTFFEYETLESIAEMYEVKVGDILTFNPAIKSNVDLKLNSFLIVPYK